MTDEQQHVYHHNVSDGAKVNLSFEKNTKGYNWSATVVGAANVSEALAMLKEADEKLSATFNPPSSSAPVVAEVNVAPLFEAWRQQRIAILTRRLENGGKENQENHK